ncbi:MAG: hypothetical protein V4660_16510 [Pseudomonadota bacterium]
MINMEGISTENVKPVAIEPTSIGSVSEPSVDTGEIVLAAPRPWWIEFLLHFSTFGAYTSIWLFLRTREFKAIFNAPLKPWLWLFVPVMAIAEIIALPKFTKHVNALEERANLKPWNAWYGTWYLLVILLTIAFNVSDKYEFPGYFLLFGLLLWAGLFSVLHDRMNKAKAQLKEYTYTSKKYYLSIIERVILLLLFPITLYFSLTLAIKPLFEKTINVLATNSVYIDKKNNFELPINDKGWKTVAMGTHSDGSAIVEFQGPLDDMYFVVFHHGHDETLNSVSYSRINSAVEENKDAKCIHTRTLSKDQKSVVAKASCKWRVLNNPVLMTVTVIETPTGIIELNGHMSSVSASYAKHEQKMLTMAAGFSPL